MDELQRYLKSEYHDAEFQQYELNRKWGTGWTWQTGVAALTGLCLFMVNFLYWMP